MKKTITSEIVVGYSQCPSKAYLLLCTRERGTQHEYMQILEKQRQIAQRNYIDNFRQENADVKPYSLDNLKGNHQYLVDATLEADGFSAKCAVLSKVRTHSAFGHYSYEPTIVVGSHTIKKEHRLEIFFVSYVLEQVQKKRPVSGYIVGLDGNSHRVKLENGSKTLIPFLEPLQEWAAEDVPKPPSLILNKHCPTCQFHNLCREKAVQEDNLSLLDGISTQKAINGYEKKGLFTVKQLSYTFKPRKRKKRTKNPPPAIHKPELQALAIREQKIYLGELPELTRQPVELFLDIEGIPDQQFYYLIGLLVSENGTTTYHPFWADTADDESRIWQQFLDKIHQYPDAPIYHYGSFERRTMTKLGRRYDTDIGDLTSRLVNVNKHIYGKVYFPVYSNRLKEIGNFIGATWTTPNASGLQSLAWRCQWEKTYNIEYKDLLLDYNEEDCQALQLLIEELSKINYFANTLSEVDFADQPKQQATEIGTGLHNQFEAVLELAHAEYDKNKISLQAGKPINNEKKKSGGQKGHPGYRKAMPKPDRVIKVPTRTECPKHNGEILSESEKTAKFTVIDLIFDVSGIKKTVTKYIGKKGFCKLCRLYYRPIGVERGYLEFGHGLRAWVIYHRLFLRLPYRVITQVLKDQFDENISEGTIAKFLKYFGAYYAGAEQTLSERILENPFIHVDETKINIRGTEQYVWVFTDGRHVVFRLTKSRETEIVHTFLSDYDGTVISDFYPGYDSLNCHQQKCWVHLLRDINEDLWKSPFDNELERFVLQVRNLIVPILEAVEEYGLKREYLSKFTELVDQFYNETISRNYKSEPTIKYQKRFLRYRESLFTFLNYDGIPWNNNMGERALRHLAIQRKISGFFFESITPKYLLLLGLMQSCRFQGKSFYKFLFSGEMHLDKFEVLERNGRA